MLKKNTDGRAKKRVFFTLKPSALLYIAMRCKSAWKLRRVHRGKSEQSQASGLADRTAKMWQEQWQIT
jgi:hypothetical protein